MDGGSGLGHRTVIGAVQKLFDGSPDFIILSAAMENILDGSSGLIQPLGFRPSNVYVAAGFVTIGVLILMHRKVPALGKRAKELLTGRV